MLQDLEESSISKQEIIIDMDNKTNQNNNNDNNVNN